MSRTHNLSPLLQDPAWQALSRQLSDRGTNRYLLP
jgi:hypothetical protein